MTEQFTRPGPASCEMPDVGNFRSVDVDHARSVLHRFYYPISVGVPQGETGFELDVQVIQLGPLTVGQLRFGSPVTLVAAELDAYHVSMPTTGRMQTRHAGLEVLATPSQGVIFGPGHPVYTLHDTGSIELNVKIERSALEEELSGLLGRPVAGPLDLPPQMDVSGGPGRSWSRLVRLLREELDHKESLIHQPLIAEQLRGSVLSGLLLSTPHRYSDELTEPATAGPPRAIRRVVDAVHDEPERAFSVGELARIGGMSVRSLQEGFRRHLGCTPMGYLQQVRLTHVHETLLRADPAEVTVAAVAHRWGFAHLGRFASTYRAQFGRSPSETLRRSYSPGSLRRG